MGAKKTLDTSASSPAVINICFVNVLHHPDQLLGEKTSENGSNPIVEKRVIA
jgi:hypothetical protein